MMWVVALSVVKELLLALVDFAAWLVALLLVVTMEGLVAISLLGALLALVDFVSWVVELVAAVMLVALVVMELRPRDATNSVLKIYAKLCAQELWQGLCSRSIPKSAP